MKKICLSIICCICLVFTACGNVGAKDYTFYNRNIYWGISQNEADEILSEKYGTINSGDTITYTLDKSEDFLKPDELFAINPTVELKFEKDKLVEIEQVYDYDVELPNNVGDLFNTYLYIALGAQEEELNEREGNETVTTQNVLYEIENEKVFLFVMYLPDTTRISVSFEPAE